MDFKIRNLVQTEYENEMFNRPGLSEEDKEIIRKLIEMKRKYKVYLQEKKVKELEELQKNLGMEMIVN
jgi:TRAP-type C4-dicarboxylate transport system substrate-binding protein